MNHNAAKTHRPPSIIETKRLILRTPHLEDAPELHQLAATDLPFAITTVGEEASTLESACTAIARMHADRASGQGAWWLITRKDTGHLVGITGFSPRQIGHGPVNALATEAIGNGYASETVAALLTAGGALTAPAEAEANERCSSPARWYWHQKSRTGARERCCA